MLRRIGAQVGLLAFALAVVVGLRAGNTPATILQRAILSLAVGFVIGQFVAWAARLAVRGPTPDAPAGAPPSRPAGSKNGASS